MTIKLQGPINTGGFSHGGVSYTPDEDGVISVPSEIANHAKAHGFTDFVERKPKTDDDKKTLKK